jgi:hypothetical protein
MSTSGKGLFRGLFILCKYLVVYGVYIDRLHARLRVDRPCRPAAELDLSPLKTSQPGLTNSCARV